MKMKYENKKNYRILLLISICSIILSCSNDSNTSKPEKPAGIPVTIPDGYRPPLTIKENINITSVNNAANVLALKWDWTATVENSSKPDKYFNISNCTEYFQTTYEKITTIPYSDNTFFMRVAAFCEATRIIANATPSTKTFLDTVNFDKHLPEQLPKQMAQIISTMESKRIMANNNISTWAQVESIIKTEKIGPYHLKYYNEGGSEELQLLAKGDFNHDGIEDMLLQINDAVEGGSYSATRLFALTRLKPEGKIQLLEQWPKEAD